jgi:hypothetical protein
VREREREREGQREREREGMTGALARFSYSNIYLFVGNFGLE